MPFIVVEYSYTVMTEVIKVQALNSAFKKIQYFLLPCTGSEMSLTENDICSCDLEDATLISLLQRKITRNVNIFLNVFFFQSVCG